MGEARKGAVGASNVCGIVSAMDTMGGTRLGATLRADCWRDGSHWAPLTLYSAGPLERKCADSAKVKSTICMLVCVMFLLCKKNVGFAQRDLGLNKTYAGVLMTSLTCSYTYTCKLSIICISSMLQ